jgi:hypothetical protein
VPDPLPADPFVSRWQASGAAERANYALFVTELCEVLEVPRPNPTVPREEDNAYVFEKPVKFSNLDGTSSDGRIDCYKRGCFVLEAKQGSDAPAADEAPTAPGRIKLESLRIRLIRLQLVSQRQKRFLHSLGHGAGLLGEQQILIGI